MSKHWENKLSSGWSNIDRERENAFHRESLAHKLITLAYPHTIPSSSLTRSHTKSQEGSEKKRNQELIRLCRAKEAKIAKCHTCTTGKLSRESVRAIFSRTLFCFHGKKEFCAQCVSLIPHLFIKIKRHSAGVCVCCETMRNILCPAASSGYEQQSDPSSKMRKTFTHPRRSEVISDKVDVYRMWVTLKLTCRCVNLICNCYTQALTCVIHAACVQQTAS
jgi:hypothetical protein